MNQEQIAAQYRQSSAHGLHPVGLVVKLYDALLEDFRRAREALRAVDVERRTTALNHALLILAELESVLDHERGGQVARHLKGLYRVARAMIVEENLRARAEGLEKLIGLFLPVRQAWQQAERELTQGAPTTKARPQHRLSGTDAEDESSRPGWNG